MPTQEQIELMVSTLMDEENLLTNEYDFIYSIADKLDEDFLSPKQITYLQDIYYKYYEN